MENIFFGPEHSCPARGLSWRGAVIPNSCHDKAIMKKHKLKTSFEYRQFINKNALSMMKENFDNAVKENTCKNDPHGEVIIPQMSMPNEKVTLHTRCDYFEKDECKNAIDIEYDEY